MGHLRLDDSVSLSKGTDIAIYSRKFRDPDESARMRKPTCRHGEHANSPYSSFVFVYIVPCNRKGVISKMSLCPYLTVVKGCFLRYLEVSSFVTKDKLLCK